MAQESNRPITDEEHAQFREILREGNQQVREALAEELGKDVDEYATETPVGPFTEQDRCPDSEN